MLTISVAALTLALSGCAPAGGLMIDGGAPDHGQTSQCMTITELGLEIAFGASVLNESDAGISITDVQLLASNTVLVSEIAIANPGTDGHGWGVVTIDDLPATLVNAWESRTPAIGATIAAGERAWLLIVARTGGTPQQPTGIQGVRVEFDGAPWPRSTQNNNYYGFIPPDGECVMSDDVGSAP
ncbi:MAG: hypothetical protein C0444_06885 [Microbacterium sp.]|nr:hypothetical protein [Microbacterium sp.]MBA4345734.1 hypothetical protein [Microbacterium sp.]